uniref:Decorin n=1 Tax=Cyprinus carpio TaxID=7962 RepID=A0A8C1MI18_CYPCA
PTLQFPCRPEINMKSACLSLLLVSVCWALPFRQSGFMDFMMEDEPGSGSPMPPVFKPRTPTPPPVLPEGPDGHFCPFRCQCHLRVSQCSDLGLFDRQNVCLERNTVDKTLILVNNKITIIHAKAFSSLINLERLYLSKNLLKDVPANIPKSLQELRIHENQINKIKKSSFAGMANVIVMELGSNPLSSSGVDNGAFADLKRVSYIRIADTNITSIPKGLPSSLFELHLDGNKITKVTADSLKGLKNLSKLGLSHNEISVVENGSLANMPHLRELHLDNNMLTSVPSGILHPKMKILHFVTLSFNQFQVIYLHTNKIAAVGTEDFCPPGYNTKKAMYSGISLFSNPVPYWEVQPITFRCVFDRSAIQLGNYRKK